METLKRFFSAPVFEGDEDKTGRARLLHLILMAQTYLLSLFLVVTIVVVLISGVQRINEIAVLVIGLFLIMIWRVLMQRGQVKAASMGLIIAFTISISLILVLGGTIRSVSVIFLPIAVVMATLLIGKRTGIVFFVIMTIIGIGLIQGEVSGFLPPPTNSITIASSFVIIASLGLTLLLLYLATQNTENALKRAIENEHEVRLLAATLEQSVNDRTAIANTARIEAYEAQAALRAQLYETNAVSRISESMRGEQDIALLSQNILRQLCQSLGAQMGAIFVLEGDILRMIGSYAYSRRKNTANQFRLGEGLVGQAALEKQPIIITNVPADYISLTSGTLEIIPRNIMAIPFQRNGQMIGVLELATLVDFTAEQNTLLEKSIESIGIAFSTAQARAQIDTLLQQTQQQAQELRIREAELRSINEQLQVQAEDLRASQDTLRRQQAD